MKVRRIQLHKVRVFQDFEVEFVDSLTKKTLSRAVLVGINGSGKTTLLEALFGSYRVLGRAETVSLVALSSEGWVEVEFELTAAEREALSTQQERVLLRTTLAATGAGWALQPRELVTPLRRACAEGKGLGGVLYFPAVRQLPPFRLEAIQKVEPRLPFAYRYVGSTGVDALKTYLVYQHYLDLQDLDRTGERGERFRRIQRLFDRLFAGKRVAGVEDMEVIIETSEGEQHGLDDLSSGEKQMLMLVVETLRYAPKGGLILVDEPEVSLHPAWQRKLLYTLEQVAPECQIIVATHSLEIAQSVYPEEVIELSPLPSLEQEKVAA
ncbi:MAG TPA: ATP-binding cassette domain-containing protein [Armatimonadetes bacterium]|nr:ATP-binding cassette domain-containing protein [Armatimonadota bacterium]